jgi:glycolate oxidase FAD binding subunit
MHLDMTSFSGIIEYHPSELVLSVRAGTALSAVDDLLAANDQMLAFEPFDAAPLYGQASGRATIGGMIAAGSCGPRRLAAGGTRDHILGFEAVSGRGEHFVAGGKVVKNVTGYDLSKLIAGSWGRLAAITAVTLKVLPRPRAQVTLFYNGLSARAAQQAAACAMGVCAGVSAAAHIPASCTFTDEALTALRVEGLGSSVPAYLALLRQTLSYYGVPGTLPEEDAAQLWLAISEARPLQSAATLWRANVPPSRGPALAEAVESLGARWFFDWAGGLVWIAHDGPADDVRTAAANAGGHVVLVRGPVDIRAVVPMLHPQAAPLAHLSERVRRAFDPHGVFETGRFLDGRHAN